MLQQPKWIKFREQCFQAIKKFGPSFGQKNPIWDRFLLKKRSARIFFYDFGAFCVAQITRTNMTLEIKWRPATSPKPAILSSFLSSQSCQNEQNPSEPTTHMKKVGVPFILTTLTRGKCNLQALKRPNPVSEWSHDHYWCEKRGGSGESLHVQVSL